MIREPVRVRFFVRTGGSVSARRRKRDVTKEVLFLVFGLGRAATSEFRRAEGIRSAAAISYFALLSFLPFLVMTLSALGFVLFTLGQGHASQEAFLDTIVQTTGEVLPLFRDSLKERLSELIQAREAMGLVGALALILTSSLVFSAIEDALNRVFRISRTRHVVKSKLLFIAFVGTLGVFAVISHYATVFIDSFIAAAGGKPLYEYVHSTALVSKLLAFVGTALGFMAILTYFCRRRISLLYLLFGASLFFGLFELAKWAFALYLEYVAQFSTLYGSLSTFMVAIIWTFYTAVIFLWAASVVKVLDARR